MKANFACLVLTLFKIHHLLAAGLFVSKEEKTFFEIIFIITGKKSQRNPYGCVSIL